MNKHDKTRKRKTLLDLIARYTFLTECKDTDLLDLGTYSKILYQLSGEDMERIKHYVQRLEEHHNDIRKIACHECGEDIQNGEEYHHHSMVLCEDCFIDESMVPKRKTHWQYLRSIKTEYLRPGKWS